ncbi:hypothetical protein Pcinc_034638 [Petrolisthes cinctipes]|uniref:Uncharacterized protein n=1 Tax=Petrolisthes cinctipes TaxID=88211 RepID=A0AAE1BY77_PETCI|nr:hypothetical protein Pcinc_034638 [Petrolisthes cinctipes]
MITEALISQATICTTTTLLTITTPETSPSQLPATPFHVTPSIIPQHHDHSPHHHKYCLTHVTTITTPITSPPPQPPKLHHHHNPTNFTTMITACHPYHHCHLPQH